MSIEPEDSMNYREIYSAQDLPPGAVIDIYGAGGRGTTLLREIVSSRPDVLVESFIDSVRRDGELEGLPIQNILHVTPADYANKIMVVASMYFREILRSLARAGHRSALVYVPFETGFHEAACRLTVTAAELSEKVRIVRGPGELPQRAVFCAMHLDSGQRGSPDAYEDMLRQACAVTSSSCAATFAVSPHLRSLPGLDQADYLLLCDTGAPVQQLDRVLAALREQMPGLRVRYWKRWEPLVYYAVAVHEKKVLYIPIPKAGCTSMIWHLRSTFEPGFTKDMDVHRPGHDKCIFVEYRMGDPAFDDYFKFSIVRNPYTRLASLYHSYLPRHDMASDYVFKHMLSRPRWSDLSFRSFCEMACACPDAFVEHHFKSQSHLLDRRPEALNAVFHLERLREEAEPVLTSLGIGLPARKINVSNTGRVDYDREYYADARLKDLVRERYRMDFDLFGFE